MNQALFQWIQQCPTAYHTVREAQRRLENVGFMPFDPTANPIVKGGKYYYKKNESSLFAFCIPQKEPASFMIGAVHGDSPALKCKHDPYWERAGFLCLNTERYGGMELTSWFDRPLALAGRVFLSGEEKTECRLVDSKEALCIIPSVAGHLMRDKGAPDPKNDLVPLYSQSADKTLYERLGVDAQRVIGSDLFLYPCVAPVQWGGKGEFISAPRLDDLQCVFAALEGFLGAKASESIPVLCVFDNEEVGSGTKQGAAGNTLLFLLEAIMEGLGLGSAQRWKLLSDSFALSADNAHGVHPNHPELSDAKDRPVLNGGVVLKFNANQRYTTDGASVAVVECLCRKKGIPLQYYSNRSDLPGGSTLGNLLVRSVPVDCADVGLAQLAMHSAVETAGACDTQAMTLLMQALFSAAVQRENGSLQIRTGEDLV